MKNSPEGFMSRALRLAVRAGRHGEVPVGAVLVKADRVIARGANAMISRSDPTAHAEIRALRSGARCLGNYRTLGCELFVTLEPCLMCYSAMVQARIKKLYYGAADPKAGVFTTGALAKIGSVFNHRFEVEAGLLGESCSALIKDFFRARRGAGAVERDGLENRYTG